MNYSVLKGYLSKALRFIVIIFALTSFLSYSGKNEQSTQSSIPNYSVVRVTTSASAVRKIYSDFSVTPYAAISGDFDSIYETTDPGVRKTTNYADKYNVWHVDSLDGTESEPLNGYYSNKYTGLNSNIILVDVFVNSDKRLNNVSDLAGRVIQLNMNKERDLKDSTVLNSLISKSKTFWSSASSSPLEKIHHHGTLMAGIAAGKTFGVAPNATVYHYPLRSHMSINTNSEKLPSDVLVEFTVEDTYRLNTLTKDVCSKDKRCVLLLPFEFENTNTYSFDVTIVLQQLLIEDRYIIVLASGNSNTHLNRTSSYIDNDVIVVGGYTLDDSGKVVKSASSNYGDRIDIYAPGVDVLAIGATNEMMISGGTSSASSVVAGWIANLLEETPSLTSKDVLKIIQQMNQTNVNGVHVRPLRNVL